MMLFRRMELSRADPEPVAPEPISAPGNTAYKVYGDERHDWMAVTQVLSCTALALYDERSGVRAMVHYNNPAGPDRSAFGLLFQELLETRGIPIGQLAVSVCYNSTSHMHTHQVLQLLLDEVFPKLHRYNECSFAGPNFYMDAGGRLFGGGTAKVVERKGFLGARGAPTSIS